MLLNASFFQPEEADAGRIVEIPSWPKLKARVDAAGAIAKGAEAFLAAAASRDAAKALDLLKTRPEIPEASLAASGMVQVDGGCRAGARKERAPPSPGPTLPR